jgi:hypothetical protein
LAPHCRLAGPHQANKVNVFTIFHGPNSIRLRQVHKKQGPAMPALVSKSQFNRDAFFLK